MDTDIRWLQRFENFERAFRLLEEVCDRGIESLSQLEQEGAVQRFELIFELSWKTMRDYLVYNGKTVEATPRGVLKESFSAGLIDDGQTWIDMMLHRNLMAHTYDVTAFEALLVEVETRYFPAIQKLHQVFLLKKGHL